MSLSTNLLRAKQAIWSTAYQVHAASTVLCSRRHVKVITALLRWLRPFGRWATELWGQERPSAYRTSARIVTPASSAPPPPALHPLSILPGPALETYDNNIYPGPALETDVNNIYAVRALEMLTLQITGGRHNWLYTHFFKKRKSMSVCRGGTHWLPVDPGQDKTWIIC